MTAHYLLRMDDACHTMNHEKWQMLENIFDDLGVKPLVAVVPDNHDPELKCSSSDPLFWDKVRGWQAKGWTIAMHGYRHVMHHTKSKLILPFYERSEFGGLTYEEQAEKISSAWKIFKTQEVYPTVWIAPAHCFDRITLQAIRNETSIRIVSDGIARDQFYEHDFHWIPQQLWGLSEKRSGLWTICLHPNTMTAQNVALLRQNLEGPFVGRVVGLDDVLLSQRRKSLPDHFEDFWFWQRHRMNKVIHKVKTVIRG